MAWTAAQRLTARRPGQRYPSDLTDAEWALVAPLIPPARRGGRPRTVDIREVFNAVLYVLLTGCQWAAIPKDLAHRSTAFRYFGRWRADGTLWRLHDALFAAERRRAGRGARPSAGILDAQAVQSAAKGGRWTPRAGTPARRCAAASGT